MKFLLLSEAEAEIIFCTAIPWRSHVEGYRRIPATEACQDLVRIMPLTTMALPFQTKPVKGVDRLATDCKPYWAVLT